MNLQTYSILLNSVVGVLIVGYGIWLRNVVKHQIEAKDSTIQSKDAEISRLRGETAPAIAEAYAKMRAHADAMTADVNRLQRLEMDAQHDRLRIEAETQVLAVQRLLTLIGPTPQGDYEAFRQAVYQYFRETADEADVRIKQLPT